MVKGINKQVIEINNTNNKYFEKIYFVVKSEYSEKKDKQLMREAKQYINSIECIDPDKVKRQFFKNKFVNTSLKLTAAAAVGAALTGILTRI